MPINTNNDNEPTKEIGQTNQQETHRDASKHSAPKTLKHQTQRPSIQHPIPFHQARSHFLFYREYEVPRGQW